MRSGWVGGFVLVVVGQVPAQSMLGVGKVDITPETAIRLSGYAARTQETTRIEQRLFARALAIGTSREDAVVVVTVDSIGLPAAVCAKIAERVRDRDGLDRKRLALCATHSHTAPHLDGLIPNMFGLDLPKDQAERITRYTARLVGGTASAVHEALESMRTGRLGFTRGSVSFAANRRTPGGPVDHGVPILVARDGDGDLVATLAAYACHCTTLAPHDDFVCGDWAGYAAEAIERAHDGAVSLIAIGCGGDQNPSPRTGLEHAKAHGATLATEIERRIASSELAPIDAAPEAGFMVVELPFASPRTREEWEARKAQGGAIGHHAAYFLERLDRGEAIESSIDLPVQVFRFGERLAMVFLGGEVVVDYSLRLGRELKSDRLFLAAYANDLPCYIPSRRVLAEGGYEAEGAMTYYGRPNRFVPEIEDRIVNAVRDSVGPAFLADSDASPREGGDR